VTKDAVQESFKAVGETIVYHYVVTNDGTVTLSTVTLTDSRLGPVAGCAAAELAPGAKTTCTAEHKTTQADLDAGSIVNVATAEGKTPSGETVKRTAEVDLPAETKPGLSVIKEAEQETFKAVGEKVVYHYKVTNSGNVTLNTVTLTDSKLGPVTGCAATELAPGASTTCTAEHETTQADLDAGSIVNVATAEGKDPAGETVKRTAEVDVPAETKAGITVTKDAEQASFKAVGETIVYHYTVKNTGTVTLSTVTLTDSKLGVVAGCAAAELAPGAATTCTAEHKTTQADLDAGSIVNVATAEGKNPSGEPEEAKATVDVPAETTAAISVIKDAEQESFKAVGETIVYHYKVTNAGNVTLNTVTLTDSKLGPVAGCDATELAPGASTTCTAEHKTTQADLDTGSILNVAEATGKGPGGEPVAPPGKAEVDVPADPQPGISVIKEADQASFKAVGETIVYHYKVTNSGNVTLNTVTLTDSKLGPVAGCDATELAPGASTTCTAEHKTTQADLDTGSIINVATAEAKDPAGETVKRIAEVDVPAETTDAISVTKDAEQESFKAVGETIVYHYVVKNTGTVTLNTVTLTDSKLGPQPACGAATLAPDESTTCTAEHKTTQADLDAGSIVNVATAEGKDPVGETVKRTAEVDVPAETTAAIGVTKDAEQASFKAVGETIVYHYVVKNTGTVTLDTVTLSDSKLGPQPACGAATLAPGESTTCTAEHKTTQADLDAGSIVNVATAEGKPRAGEPVKRTAEVDVPAETTAAISVTKESEQASFKAVGETIVWHYTVKNDGTVTLNTVTLTDSKLGPVAGCAAAELAPGAKTTCTAEHVTTQADLDAGAIVNVATAEAKTPSGETVRRTAEDEVPAETTATISVTKVAEQASFKTVGETIVYHYTVKNDGTVTLKTVALTDDRLGPIAGCDAETLAPGASTECTATHVIAVADLEAGSIVNTATAEGKTLTGETVKKTATAIVPADTTPALSMVKTANPSMFTAAGQTITYTFKVSNIGATPLVSIAIADPLPGLSPIVCPATSLAIAASMSCTATYITTVADLALGTLANTATATATDANGNPATPSSSTAVIPVVATAIVRPPAPEAGQGTLGEKEPSPSAGAASVHGPRECVASKARIYVTGRQIKSVTFYMDGPRRKLRTVARADKKGRYLINISARQLSARVHRVEVVVVFEPSSKTKPKRLRVVLERCPPAHPLFTG
jgi:uncharacterized repeat protein (TIGR01451 family)